MPWKTMNALAVSIGGRTITNLRFAGDIDGLVEEQEQANLVECLNKAVYGLEISAGKTRLMTASAQRSKSADRGLKLTVHSFKYLR